MKLLDKEKSNSMKEWLKSKLNNRSNSKKILLNRNKLLKVKLPNNKKKLNKKMLSN